jgi:hypothetical protein
MHNSMPGDDLRCRQHAENNPATGEGEAACGCAAEKDVAGSLAVVYARPPVAKRMTITRQPNQRSSPCHGCSHEASSDEHASTYRSMTETDHMCPTDHDDLTACPICCGKLWQQA